MWHRICLNYAGVPAISPTFVGIWVFTSLVFLCYVLCTIGWQFVFFLFNHVDVSLLSLMRLNVLMPIFRLIYSVTFKIKHLNNYILRTENKVDRPKINLRLFSLSFYTKKYSKCSCLVISSSLSRRL